MLIRKLRQRCQQNLLCIGTSATMSTEGGTPFPAYNWTLIEPEITLVSKVTSLSFEWEGSRENIRSTVAHVASKLFGSEVKPQNVIDETLTRSIDRPEPTLSELQTSLDLAFPPESNQTLAAFKAHPLSAWIEMNFGLKEDNNHLTRRTPISLDRGAQLLSELTQVDRDRCLVMLRQMFLWGSKTKGLTFRLHQFVSQGGSVYATIQSKTTRLLTLDGQYSTTSDRLLYPIVFCRECGHDYYTVRYDPNTGNITPTLPTQLDFDNENTDIKEGYLTLDEPDLWQEEDCDRLPDTWFNISNRNGRNPKKTHIHKIPTSLRVMPNGKVTESLFEGVSCWFLARPFPFCLHCETIQDGNKSEFRKLSRLSSEGRSTATTLLCLSTVNRLKAILGTEAEAAKILSFTDNRQDASLQAGHFNDFVQTTFLRASLHSALQANQTLTHSVLAREVLKKMDLPQEAYAKNPTAFDYSEKNKKIFQDLIEYRLYEDLRRGWRIVQPNLEQCGLLEIKYLNLDLACADPTLWAKYQHPILQRATPEQRYIAAKVLLDQLRKELAIDSELMQSDRIDQLKKEVGQAIKSPWKIDTNETIHYAKWASIVAGETSHGGNYSERNRQIIKLTSKSKIGRFLRSERAWSWLFQPLTENEYNDLMNYPIAASCGVSRTRTISFAEL